MPRNPGEMFAGYTIIRLIGRGGMGEIYLAKHPHLPRTEAIKVLPSDLSRDPSFRQRFVREAELASSVVHPAIVTIFNSGEYDGHLWIAMEYIDGIDGLQLLRRNPQGVDDATVGRIARSVGAALDQANAAGLLHRDVKPANILLQGAGVDLRVLLADFGIAKSEQDVSHLTSTNMFLGTVAYAAPEQLIGEHVDGRADQYSLAATVFELLTGRQPFPGTNSASVIAHHLNSLPPRASSLRPGISPAVDAVLGRALSKAPEQRYPSSRAFADALVDAMRQRSTPSRPAVPPPTTVPHPPVSQQQLSQRPGPFSSGAQPQPVYGGPPSGAFGGGPFPPTEPPKKKSGLLIGLSVAAVVLLVIIIGGVAFIAGRAGDTGTTAAASSTRTTPPTTDTTATTGPSPTTDPGSRTVEPNPQTITGPGEIAVGQCLQVKPQPGAANTVVASKVGCDSSGLNFYAASRTPSSASCTSTKNSAITFAGESDKLCLTPNFLAGLCYQIPLRSGTLADYMEVTCAASAAPNTAIARVSERGTSSISCTGGDSNWTFTEPQSIGYCLTEV